MPASNGYGPCRYRIVVRGRLSERDAAAFEDMTLEPGVGVTILEGELVDQAQVYGVLDRLRGLDLELVSFSQDEC
ncbi:MAG: hypothetical protein ACRD0C_12050 [Acidimicrobiia bacterium]